ncbi:unnamed protein product [Aphis gossypii]|uniref:Uncharacterized protein n=1 Tax=Aphis gossypii TaxID=80765 RepID=A0A9P0JFF8_APHGO|nr:unnamed protein product [Aphis gossypii]
MASISSNFSESVMCEFRGNLKEFNSISANLDPKSIPIECEVIIYSTFTINASSFIDVDEALLKSVTDLKKPVIVALEREKDYQDWISILHPDGNAPDALVLCDFALKHNVLGFVLRSIWPFYDTPLNETLGIFLIAYIKQLKQCKPELIIGVSIPPTAVTNSSTFLEFNDLVTFYEIEMDYLFQCTYFEAYVTINNTVTQQTAQKSPNPDFAGLLGSTSLYLQTTPINVLKLTYDIEIYPQILDVLISYTSYAQVCKGPINKNQSCIETSKDFYNMVK